jgi:hypothetical protein
VTKAPAGPPVPGSVVLCLDCQAVSVFDEGMNLRPLRDADRPVRSGGFWGLLKCCGTR